MKDKLFLWTLVAMVMGMVIYQNHDFYLSEETLNLNLYVAQVQLPAVPKASQFLFIFLAGILLASLSYLAERLRFKKEAKNWETAFRTCSARVVSMDQQKDQARIGKGFKWPAIGIRKKAGLPKTSPSELPASGESSNASHG